MFGGLLDQIRFLKNEFSKSAIEGNQKVLIMLAADRMTEGAANSLLKFIEEPVGNVAIFLLTADKSAILPTIISRTQVINFPSLPPQLFFKSLRSAEINPKCYRLIASMTDSLAAAKKWNIDQWFLKLQSTISLWFHLVAHRQIEAFPLVQIRIMPLLRRASDKQVVMRMLIQLWRDVLDFKFGQLPDKNLSFPDSVRDVRFMAKTVQVNELLKIIKLMLFNGRLLSRNVNCQNILERTTLKTLMILG